MANAIEKSQHLSVFISYSRRDALDFADQLAKALDALGYRIIIDREGISGGELWQARLGQMLLDCDTVLFVMSPESAVSPVCAWEVDEAARVAKRIIPVIAMPLGSAKPPERLQAMNYIHFYPEKSVPGSGFGDGLVKLNVALKSDLDWLREHTRLLARALEWDKGGRTPNRMLSGPDIGAAKSWAARRPNDAPEPTALQLDYIKASEQSETERTNIERQRLEEMGAAQAAKASALADREVAVKTLSRRTTVGLISAGGLTAAAARLAWWGHDAERRFQEERRNVALAEKRALEDAINKAAMRTDIAGQLTAFAAAPDQLALDGPNGGNSPFTQAVMEALVDETSSFQAALARATANVLEYAAKQPNAFGHQQRPFLSTDMNGELFLFRKPASRKIKALVISCDKKPSFGTPSAEIDLPNAERDGFVWEQLLVRAGFETKRLVNPNFLDCEAALERLVFSAREQRGLLQNKSLHRIGLDPPSAINPPGNTLVFVYYSGTGAVVGGDYYLSVIDTQIEALFTRPKAAINLTKWQSKLRGDVAASILVMDTNFTRIYERDTSAR